jgi:hypothetical protein
MIANDRFRTGYSTSSHHVPEGALEYSDSVSLQVQSCAMPISLRYNPKLGRDEVDGWIEITKKPHNEPTFVDL